MARIIEFQGKTKATGKWIAGSLCFGNSLYRQMQELRRTTRDLYAAKEIGPYQISEAPTAQRNDIRLFFEKNAVCLSRRERQAAAFFKGFVRAALRRAQRARR
ncbi:MAG: hypothetical protein ACOYKJ_06595 [Candidatus Howiella sp.]|jgi:hypothetical protein